VVLAAPVAGSVARLLVATGSAVAPGEVVATVAERPGHEIAIRAGATGTVEAVSVTPGQLVQPGSTVITVDHPGAPLNAVLFADAAAGLALSDGERVSVAFPGGSRTGFVTDVSLYPVGPADVQRLFGAAAIPGAPGRVVRLVTVRIADAVAFPGASLTPITATVTIASQRPFDIILHGGQP
jgi:hypothetical protein